MGKDYSIALGGIARGMCVLVPPVFFITLSTICTKKSRYFEIGHDYSIGLLVLTWIAYVAYRFHKNRRVRLSPQYDTAFKASFWQHAIVVVLASLMLDGGLTLYCSMLAMIVFWMTVGIIIARRPDSPRESDIAIISWGYILLAFSIACFAWSANTLLP